MPAIRPEADPDMSIVATEVFVLFHVPPGVALLNVVVLPAQIDALPVIGASGFTVIVRVAEQPVPVV